MEKQKKKESGITLVALVVSIIVMLVLAGVSLNATVGENGIVTRAQEAALKQKVAEELETLNLELAKINIDTISTDEAMAIQDIANYLVGNGTIDSFITTSARQIATGIDTITGNKYFFGIKGDNTYRITRGIDGLLSAELTTQTSGGDITGGYVLVTADSFTSDNTLPATEKGKFTITDDAEVVFMDGISGALSIYVADNVHATVGIYADMTLTNQNISRSAIDISKNNGVLDLYIGTKVNEDGNEVPATVTVNSGVGIDASELEAGKGGYAGIHVPSGATLNIRGNGIVIATAGNGSNGATIASGVEDRPGPGGGGAGAGIGGNGGNGGEGKSGVGVTGYTAESCGNINIYGESIVYAYGGSGGSGGAGLRSTGGGAGGYPGAGIGGGGAGGGGGTCCTGSGGYSGGTGEGGNNTKHSLNGSYGGGLDSCNYHGGGYYEGGQGTDVNGLDRSLLCLGGLGGPSWQLSLSDRGGNGGQAGNGGIVKVSRTSKVYSFNGNMYTDSEEGHEYNNGLNQAPFYLQHGDVIAKYDYVALATSGSNDTRFKLTIESEYTTTDLSGYYNKIYEDNELPYKDNRYITKNSVLTNVDMATQGVGSGAGYTEVSNGSYTIYNEDNLGNFTTVYTGV